MYNLFDEDPFSDPLDDLGSDTLIQDYVSQKIAEIPLRGDAARVELVEYCYDHFDWEPPDSGILTDAQRASVDTFAHNYPKL